jgi:CHAT domain-containing protein/Tfp pilus assembly protein PilF
MGKFERESLNMSRTNKPYQHLMFYYGLTVLIVWNGVLSDTGIRPIWATTGNHLANYKALSKLPLANVSLSQDKELVLGEVVMQELKGGESHRYRLSLAAEQYVDLVAEQQGIDVVVRLFGPDGKMLAEVDSPNGTAGPEPLPYITNIAGTYQIEVGSLEKDAPMGRYSLKLISLRAANPIDRQQLQLFQLEQEANALSSQNKFKEAIATLEKAIALREKILGPDHPDVATSLSNLTSFYQTQGNYTKAEEVGRRALAIQEKVFGHENLGVATTLNRLALCYQADGNYQEAAKLFEDALKIFEKLVGKDDTRVATLLNNLAVLYEEVGDYRAAEPLFQRALAIAEKALGRDHLDVATTINNLAVLYNSKADYQRAETLFRESLAIREKQLGPEHPGIAGSLNNLGSIYRIRGAYREAISLYQRSLAIREKVFGQEHTEIAQSLNNLAGLYQEGGDYRAAEPFFQRALAIYEKALGHDHPDVATVINNLAELYKAKADYQRAETLFRESLAIWEKQLGPEHSNVALSLNNLGSIYRIRGAYREAISLYQRSLAIREKVLGQEHTDIAVSLNNLAVVYKEMGDRQQAAALYERALAINERVLGKENEPVAFVLSNLAEIYNDQEQYQRASEVLARALAIREKVFGITEHPLITINLNSLAELALRQGQIAPAISYQQRSLESREGELLRNLVTGSEKQKLIYLKSLIKEQDFSVSLHLRSAISDEQAAKLALTTILRRKGRALDVMTDSINRLRAQAMPEDQGLLAELSTLRAQLSTLALRGVGKQSLQAHQAQLKALEEKIEALESRISNRSVEFRAQTTRVTLAAVQQAIPEQAALVEFITYRPYDVASRRFMSTHYAVYALDHKGVLRWADLGEARKLESLINQLRQQLRRNPSQAPRALRALKTTSQQLTNLLLTPLQDLITAKTQLLISPDGALNFVPFDALVDNQGKYLIERYAISYLTSGRDLLRLQLGNQPNNSLQDHPTQDHPTTAPLVVANPAYGVGAGPVLGGQQATPLQQLPGAAQEAQRIRSQLPQAIVYTAEEATERLLKQVKSPQILHIATHGYFLDKVAKEENAVQSRALEYTPSGEELAGLRADNPLLRAWLFFAGANNAQTSNQVDVPIEVASNADDGILTALEAANLNLSGTKLVVLSACQTGLGEVESGEGVYGLRRALVLAGAEAQLTSLWAIDDRATRDLMGRYYQLLQQGAGRQAALRQVQLEFLHNNLVANSKNATAKSAASNLSARKRTLRTHPYYWAGFILSGEWGNLKGNR